MPDIWVALRDLRSNRKFSGAPAPSLAEGSLWSCAPTLWGDRTRTICVTSSLQLEAGGTNPTLGDIAPLTGCGRGSLLSETP